MRQKKMQTTCEIVRKKWVSLGLSSLYLTLQRFRRAGEAEVCRHIEKVALLAEGALKGDK